MVMIPMTGGLIFLAIMYAIYCLGKMLFKGNQPSRSYVVESKWLKSEFHQLCLIIGVSVFGSVLGILLGSFLG